MTNWRAWCDCGWKGEVKGSSGWARRDLWEHYDDNESHRGEGNIEEQDDGGEMKS